MTTRFALNVRRSLLILFIWFAALPAVDAARAPLKIDKLRSQLGIHVTVTLDSFDIKVADYDPVIVLETKTQNVVEATLGFRFTDLKSGTADRDQQILDWENASEYPSGSFALTELQALGPSLFEARGKLTFHGVTRPVRFPVTIQTDHSLFLIDGNSSLDTREFGLPILRKFAFFTVNPVVQISFHLQGTL